MSEPVDHRAEAERMLSRAWDWYGEMSGGPESTIAAALIGIGHALLAGIDVLVEDEGLDEQCTWRYDPYTSWTPDRYAKPTTAAGLKRCVLWADHKGDHRIEGAPTLGTTTSTKISDWHPIQGDE